MPKNIKIQDLAKLRKSKSKETPHDRPVAGEDSPVYKERVCNNCGRVDEQMIYTVWEACPECAKRVKGYKGGRIIGKRSNMSTGELGWKTADECPVCGKVSKVVYKVNGKLCHKCLDKI